MSIEKNIQAVKEFLAAMGGGDGERLLALAVEEIKWIIPGEDWPLAGTYVGHNGLEVLLGKASKAMKTSFDLPLRISSRMDL